MNIDLHGKSALVTGGNIGIGRAIAIALAERGADVAITYLSHSGEETVEAIRNHGRNGVALKLDATSSAEVDSVVAQAADALGGLDILVNNAGGLVGRVLISEMSDEHWQKVLSLNLSSTFYCSRAAVRYMKDGWGRIVNISSLAGINGGGNGSTAYAASKAGMHAFTIGLAKELAPRGITVNAVAPGFIVDTPFHETFSPPEAQQASIAATALKRAGTPADVAGAVLYLASDLASFVTGDVLDVNGGQWFA